MAYNTKAIITDLNGKPVPQIYEPVADAYEALTGIPLGNAHYGADHVSWGKTSAGVFVPVQVDANGVVQTSQTSAQLGSVVTMQNAAVAIGVGTALPTSGAGVGTIAISGTFVATITFEGQGPDGSWYPVSGRLRGNGAVANTATVGGLYEVNCRGLTAVRANTTAYTSGSVTAKGVAQPLPAASDTVSLSGRNVSETIFFNALAITDTAIHNSSSSPYADVTLYGGRKMLIVYNTLDQTVTVNVLTAPKSGVGGLQCNQNFAVTTGKSLTITASDIRELGEPLNRMAVRLNCTVAPTTGSVSAWMEGNEV